MRLFRFTFVAAMFLLAGCVFVLAQDEEGPGEAVAIEAEDARLKWCAGKVVSIDAPSGAVVLKTLDYESGKDTDISIFADGSTVYDNLNSFSEIKPLDSLSIDYSVTKEGKNLAKSINLELPSAKDAPEPAYGSEDPGQGLTGD